MLCVERVSYSPLFETIVHNDLQRVPRAQPQMPRAHLPQAVASHLHTASIDDLATIASEDGSLDASYTVLVTRQWPIGLAEHAIDEWWPTLAPSLDLLRTPRAAVNASMPDSSFAARYLAELADLSHVLQMRYLVRLGMLLRRHHTVTLVSYERTRARAQKRTQREILRGWFLGDGESFHRSATA